MVNEVPSRDLSYVGGVGPEWDPQSGPVLSSYHKHIKGLLCHYSVKKQMKHKYIGQSMYSLNEFTYMDTLMWPQSGISTY